MPAFLSLPLSTRYLFRVILYLNSMSLITIACKQITEKPSDLKYAEKIAPQKYAIQNPAAHLDKVLDARYWRHISTADGLSQSYVYSIGQTDLGFMLFGTQSGVDRFDGAFRLDEDAMPKPYNRQDELTNGYCRVLHQDRQNRYRIWVGTSTGLCNISFDTAGSKYDLQNYSVLLGRDIRSIWTGDSTIWFWNKKGKSSTLHYMQTTDLNLNMKKEAIPTHIDNVTAFTGSGNRLFWATATKVKYEVQSVEIGRQNSLIWPSEDTVSTLYANDHFLWMGAGNQVLQYNWKDRQAGNMVQTQPIPVQKWSVPAGAEISVIKVDSKERLWIGTRDHGLWVATHDKAPQLVPLPITKKKSFRIHSLYESRDSVIWVGTDRGLFHFSEHRQIFEVYFQDSMTFIHGKIAPNHREMFSFCQDPLSPSRVWIGKNDDEIICYDFENIHDFQIYSIGNSKITTVYNLFFTPTALWVCTLEGIYRARLRQRIPQKFEKITNLSECRATLQKGDTIWVGTQTGGVYCLTNLEKGMPVVDTLKEFKGIEGNRIHTFARVGRNGLWMGTDHGLFDVRTQDSISLNGNKPEIYSIYYDSTAQKVYLGTKGDGLIDVSLEKKPIKNTEPIIISKGLSDQVIYSICQNPLDQSLWLATNRGLCRFFPNEGKVNGMGWSIQNYGYEDGLPFLEFNVNAAFFLKKDSTYLIGGQSGFVKVKPYYFKHLKVDTSAFCLIKYSKGKNVRSKEDIITSTSYDKLAFNIDNGDEVEMKASIFNYWNTGKNVVRWEYKRADFNFYSSMSEVKNKVQKSTKMTFTFPYDPVSILGKKEMQFRAYAGPLFLMSGSGSVNMSNWWFELFKRLLLISPFLMLSGAILLWVMRDKDLRTIFNLFENIAKKLPSSQNTAQFLDNLKDLLSPAVLRNQFNADVFTIWLQKDDVLEEVLAYEDGEWDKSSGLQAQLDDKSKAVSVCYDKESDIVSNDIRKDFKKHGLMRAPKVEKGSPMKAVIYVPFYSWTVDEEERLVQKKTGVISIQSKSGWSFWLRNHYSLFLKAVGNYAGAYMTYEADDMIKALTIKNLEIENMRLKNEILLPRIGNHFLRNSVKILKGLSLGHESLHKYATGLEKIYDHLLNYFQVEKHTLTAEKAFLEEVVESMIIAYQRQIDFDFHVPKGLERLEIPLLLIQPYIENSIIHGIRGKTDPSGTYVGKVTIQIEDSGHFYFIHIIDNGMGVVPAAFEKPQSNALRINKERVKNFNKFHKLNEDNGMRIEGPATRETGDPAPNDKITTVTICYPKLPA